MLRGNEIKNRLFIILLLIPQILFAATNDDVDEDDFFDDIPTILTVSRLEQPKSEAPSSVTIIDRDMIKASGARQISDIFRLVPGFIVGNPTGNTTTVAYHGLGARYNRHLQVLIDGRSVYIPSFGGIPWTSLPISLEDIERVEVTRGPNAASYGSNSFLAVINIMTREAYQDTGINLTLLHSNDQSNISDAYASISQQYADYDFRISAKTLSDDGYKPFNGNIQNDSKDVSKFNFKSNFLIQQNSQWSFQLGQTDASLLTGDGQTDNILRPIKVLNQYQTLRYEESSANSSTNIQIFHTTHDNGDSFDIPLGIVNYDRFSERSEIEFERTLDLSKQLRTVFGGSYRKDTVDSFYLLGPNQKQSINVSRLFAHAEYKFDPDKILNIGGLIEKSDITDVKLSPRIAYVQHLSQFHTIRFSYSKAFRNPILFEINGFQAFKLHITPIILQQLQPNPDLKPEQIDSLEIGLYSQVSSALQTDIKLYRYRLSNQITGLNTPNLNIIGKNIKQFINSDQTTHASGIELSLTYKPNAKVTIISGANTISVDSPIRDLEYSFPNSTFFIHSQYQFNNHHSISGSYYYYKNIGWFEFTADELANTNKLDLRYAYNFSKPNDAPITLEIIGQNLLSDYLDYRDFNIQEASFFIKLSSSF